MERLFGQYSETMTDADTRKPYHHGDLRAAAVAAAVAEVEEVGVSAASMRRIARRAGVTHAALAHHFTEGAGGCAAGAAGGGRRGAAAGGPGAAGGRGGRAGGAGDV